MSKFSHNFYLVFIFFSFVKAVCAADDPVTNNHPLWTITQGKAKIDGIIEKNEWNNAFRLNRSQAWRDDGVARVFMMYSQEGLYLAADVDDKNLWADGTGGGAGNRWEVETDDSITFYFDADKSREIFFSENDRAFGVNLANPNGPINSQGTVLRWKYVKGSGDGGAPDVFSGGKLEVGTDWATQVNGSVNQGMDDDTGWTTEIFLPWKAINMSPPVDGQTMGMNFDLIFDNTGGLRDLTDHRSGPLRFQLPTFVDDHIQGVHSSYHSTLAGIYGPINYAEVMFVESNSSLQTEAIKDLTIESPSAFGATLSFSAPGIVSPNQGHASYYEIRYSESPITDEQSWLSAQVFEHGYIPKLRGQRERLRIAGLNPGKHYYVAVRARSSISDRLGGLSNSGSITIKSTQSNNDKGRIIVSPQGTGLAFEDGTPFFSVGEHAGISWGYFRNLYPGDVWDPVNQKFQNYFHQPSYEGKAKTHFETLAASGVNTLRLYLETLNMDQTGNTEKPKGRYWIEYPAGQFNPDMKQYVLNALKEAAKNDIYLIIAPFDSGQWDETFTQELPYYNGNGGPLSSINDFFQTPETLEMAKARMKAVIDWVKESPYSDHLLAWDPLSEWDSYEWTLNAEGNAFPGRENEMLRRVNWIKQLNDYIRAQDPEHLIMNSTTVRDPRGPLARYLFLSNDFDFLGPHFYTTSSEEPINNPDVDKKVRPAVENGLLTTYWLTHQENHVPILNSEWGMTRDNWINQRPTYSANFTQAEDEDLYRTVSWSGLASGQLGPGLRIVTEELVGNFNSLTDEMRATELSISSFINSPSQPLTKIRYNRETLAGNVRASSATHFLKVWGISDGQQGISYVLKDGNRTQGQVTDGFLSLSGLNSRQLVDVEFWNTKERATKPETTLKNQLTLDDGSFTVAMPSFNEDMAIKFKTSACAVFYNSTLHIPCVKDSNNDVYTASLNLEKDSALTFKLNSLQKSKSPTSKQCASYDHQTTKLNLPCVLVGNKPYWADLMLRKVNPISLQVLDYGQ